MHGPTTASVRQVRSRGCLLPKHPQASPPPPPPPPPHAPLPHMAGEASRLRAELSRVSGMLASSELSAERSEAEARKARAELRAAGRYVAGACPVFPCCQYRYIRREVG